MIILKTEKKVEFSQSNRTAIPSENPFKLKKCSIILKILHEIKENFRDLMLLV